MAYTVKLKNQNGEEVNYNSIEQVSIPHASGTENVLFVATYDVTKIASLNITYDGGDKDANVKAANGVDYMCRISTGNTGKNVPDSITVNIGDSKATANEAYVYTKVSDTEAIVRVKGSYITGDITISAEAESA